jgi:hypothetical protein
LTHCKFAIIVIKFQTLAKLKLKICLDVPHKATNNGEFLGFVFSKKNLEERFNLFITCVGK